ncbi:MAG: diaminopimelate epimerase [Lachnospiraceae bacterium]|jgi:diaminopimelate epimerase|nr:diaminopimelate epimerase [Lachnospiraceae bacterium]
MKFTKMQGAGNDYVYVNCFQEEVKNPQEISKFVSDRHFGIGADGLILIQPSQQADFKMAMYNADGSQGEMCGNAIRCVAKYVYDHGMTDKTQISIDTLAGIKYLELTLEHGEVSQVRVNMGTPCLTADKIPVVAETEQVVNVPIDVGGRTCHITAVSMGNPHCVLFLEEDVRTLDLSAIGPHFENHPRFPKRINTEFVNVIDEHTLRMRVWERGSGETLACGTGSCASAVAAMLNGKCDREVTVLLTGGKLNITWEGSDAPVYMTGPAVKVFEGEIELPEEIR